jgi:hypothetical protein
MKTPTWLHRSAVALVCAPLVGCMTMQPPATDTSYFDALPVNQRMIVAPTIVWQVREDASAVCARLTGKPVTPLSRPMACAQWNPARQECTVITPTVYGVNYLGHEVRHCFEGHFHH